MSYQKHCPGCFRRKGGEAVCEHCGYDESAPRSPLFLPHGSLLAGQYRVGRVLGGPGGFGITYLGWDVKLQQRVAIKEFLPRDIAARRPQALDVTVQTERAREGFEGGRDAFLHEARVLASLNHPSVVRVRGWFRANDTGYLVMDWYEGRSLDACLREGPPRLPVELALALVRALASGLHEVHRHGLVHRDVKPHNLYLATAGRPILLDFGAALPLGSAGVAGLLTPGYAPPEQYRGDVPQGAATDVYGLCATLYRCLLGCVPPAAPDREQQDLLTDAAAWPELPEPLQALLLRGLALQPQERYGDMLQLIGAIDGVRGDLPDPAPEIRRLAAPPAAAPPPAAAAVAPRIRAPDTLEPQREERDPLRFLLLALALVSVGAVAWAIFGKGTQTQDAPRSTELTAAERARLPQLIAVPAGSLLPLDAQGAVPAAELPPFRISRSEITVAQFRLFVNRSGYRGAAWDDFPCVGVADALSWDRPGYEQQENYPVVCVSAADAMAFADWLSLQLPGPRKRLPTEAEWEHAARGGSTTHYWWGDHYEPQRAACAGCPPRLPEHPGYVGARPPNPYGLVDVAGNVREWTCSVFAPLSTGSYRDCAAQVDETSNLVVRGGSWQEPMEALRSGYRRPFSAYQRNVWTGFRIVEEAAEP